MDGRRGNLAKTPKIDQDGSMPPNPMFVTTTRATAIPFSANESVIFKIRKSVLFLLVPIVLVSVVGVSLAVVINSLALPNQIATILRLGIVVAIIFVDLVMILDWLTTTYTLTNRRVQFEFGIISHQTKTITLSQITDVQDQIGILGRIFNYGNVRIEAANINSEILFRGISSPGTRKSQIDDAQLAVGP